MIRRHSPSAIFMHWFNAALWLLLTFTGFGMLASPAMQPVGHWWAAFWTGLFGPLGLLQLHATAGVVWVAVYALFLLAGTRRVAVAFLREICRLHPASDAVWCLRKGGTLVLGERGMRRLGLNPSLPPQGFYNAGQKLVAVIAVLCGLGLAVTGGLMIAFAGRPGGDALLRVCLLVHFLCAGVMAVLLPVHIYMAALAPGEGPAMRSMLTGFVPRDFVRRHNPLWFEQLLRSKDAGAEE